VSERKERCEMCRFWDIESIQPGEKGVHPCRRFPPNVKLDGMVEGTDLPAVDFPLTYRDDWCGEWQAVLPVRKKRK
jgi:hypothetical protein